MLRADVLPEREDSRLHELVGLGRVDISDSDDSDDEQQLQQAAAAQQQTVQRELD